MNEKNKIKKQGQELPTRRILAIFLVTALILWGMSFLYDIMTYGTTFMQGQRANNILLGVSAALTAVLLIICLSVRKSGKAKPGRVLSWGFFLFCAGLLFLSSLIFKIDYYHGMHILNVLLPLIAVLILVYYIYERQFFTFCVVESVSIFAVASWYLGLWEKTAVLAAAIVLCAVPMLLTGAKGEKAAKWKQNLLGKQFDCSYTLVVYGATILLMAAAALIQGKSALFIGLGMGVYVLGAAVYYTIKSM